MSRALLLTAATLLACSSCSSAPTAAPFRADGIFVRNVGVRVRPGAVDEFEALLESCVAGAHAQGLTERHDWLCYREVSGRFFFVWFAHGVDGFAFADGPDPLRDLARQTAGEAAVRTLDGLEYDVEWDAVVRQTSAWSTVRSMTTRTHPEARMFVYSVEAGRELAFEAALRERTAFLLEQSYPIPVEGFGSLPDAPVTAMQVLFPTDWARFHAEDSFEAFSATLEDADRERFDELSRALADTLTRVEVRDGSHAPELSFGDV